MTEGKCSFEGCGNTAVLVCTCEEPGVTPEVNENNRYRTCLDHLQVMNEAHKKYGPPPTWAPILGVELHVVARAPEKPGPVKLTLKADPGKTMTIDRLVYDAVTGQFQCPDCK